MNPRLFELYKSELQHIREMGGEFAQEYPKIAGRLGLETLECADPYVERLLEAYAFFSARVQLKIESSQSKLARHLLEMVYPTYLAPTPSMCVAEFVPSKTEGSLEQGFVIERGTRLRSQKAPDEKTECDFRTSHDLTLRPITIEKIRYLSSSSAVEAAGIKAPKTVRSGLGLSLELPAHMNFAGSDLSDLSIFLCGADNSGPMLYEQLFAHTIGVSLLCDGKEVRSPRGKLSIERQGFEDNEALLPVSTRGFQGHRLLQEYFTLPERFQFAKVTGFEHVAHLCENHRVELVFLFDNMDDSLGDIYSTENFRLNCTPAINLFPKSADRINMEKSSHEYHIVVDRTRPMDFEIYSIDSVVGFGTNQSDSREFFPYFSISERRRSSSSFYHIHREPRLLSSKQKQRGPRASYIGSEAYLSLVDADESPVETNLRQLALTVHCTNRDLPLQMPVGRSDTDFILDIGAPVESIRCIAGPSVPKQSRAHFRDAWSLVSNLSLNYLSIDSSNNDDGESAAAMFRQMLELYADENKGADKRQIEGVLSIMTKPIAQRRQYRSHIEVARGLEITISLDDSAFEGAGSYLLGSVLERFFARYCSINSFTQTVLITPQRNEIERWDVQLGQRGIV